MNRCAVVQTLALVAGMLTGAPAASAAPGCGPVTGGGGDNPAILLHDVQTGSDEDSDWISFVFDNSVKHGPRGGVLYWGVPEFTVAPTNDLGYTIGFKGGVAHAANERDKPYGGAPVTAPPNAPFLNNAAQVKDGDYGNSSESLVWGIGLKTPRCPTAEFRNLPPRVVVEFPH